MTFALAFAAVSQTQPQPAPINVAGGDKLLHFGASLVVTDAAWAGAALLDAPLWARVVVATGVGATVGIGKETYDAFFGGTPDAADLVYDAFGIGAGIGFALAVEAIVQRARASDASGPGDAAVTTAASPITPATPDALP